MKPTWHRIAAATVATAASLMPAARVGGWRRRRLRGGRAELLAASGRTGTGVGAGGKGPPARRRGAYWHIRGGLPGQDRGGQLILVRDRRPAPHARVLLRMGARFRGC